MDLSALTIFSPVPTGFDAELDVKVSDFQDSSSSSLESVARKRQKIDKPLDGNDLIYAVPWYKTVNNLHLWNVSFIDIVLISSPMGLLGLPFLTQMKGFSAKIYVTEVTTRLGQLMMEDLVAMHMEFRQFYGPEVSSFPQWMRWEELELLPSALREVVLGKDGAELGAWMPLYSAADVTDCIQKVQTLRYAEEACYNGTLIIKACSSGLEIGTCNWTINGPKRDVAFISSSIFLPAHAMKFDYHALQGNDVILYSDFSPLDAMEDVEDVDDISILTTDSISTLSMNNKNWEESIESLLNTDENLGEREKLSFLCSCTIDSLKAGGSVLIPFNRLGTLLQLLEEISASLESSTLKVPIYVISSVAEELLAYTNVIPEWLCKERQEKLFSGESLFAHVELIKENKLHVFPAVHSPKLLTNWQEPCIVFSPHWSLRLGPVVHFLRRWCGDPNSLLVLESGLDAELAFLPFKPMAMKVLQCSFLSGIKLQKVQPLMQMLQPKIVLLPDDLRQQVRFPNANSFSVVHYSENASIRIPSLKDSSELEIATDMAFQFQWRNLKHENMNVTRLKGELSVYHGKHWLLSGNEQAKFSKSRPLLHWGSPDVEKLLSILSKMGINGSVERGADNGESEQTCMVHVHEPKKALIEIGTSTVISAVDENLASQIFEAIDNILDGI
uniref:Beta-Casp domain-containing protein n=1 Tax=Fagus sylvatica TaxID=28930 RepID=A0A2N9I2M8_FAGSY